MANWYDVFTNERTQLKLWKSILSYIGINWNKLPNFRNIVRINICCLNSALFFIGTWILFYAIVMILFCGIFLGAAALLGVK